MNGYSREEAVTAARDMGKAEGLEAAGRLILSLVLSSTRVVGTDALKEAVAGMNEVAADLRKRAKKTEAT